MTAVRLATFDAENLFARYRFKEESAPVGSDGFTRNDLAFDIYDDDNKKVTTQAIHAVDADVICLQEVENLEVLERFNSRYLPSLKYRHRLVIDSHDPRFIDVAVLSRYPFRYINTHRHERNAANTTWLFSRDCLEVDIDVEGKILSLYVNHLKSMIYTREETHAKRKEQADRVVAIMEERWAGSDYAGDFVVLGDFNDYMDSQSALTRLVNHEALENVVSRLPDEDRWTHFWAGGHEYTQLDYLLPSKRLADRSPGLPGIERRGLPWRADRFEGERFPDVGENAPKASDHCPLYMDLKLG